MEIVDGKGMVRQVEEKGWEDCVEIVDGKGMDKRELEAGENSAWK